MLIGLGDATNVYYWNYEAGAHVWATSATERMRIDSSGNLNFSQEASSNYPEQKLKWSNDSTTTNGFYISQDSSRNGRVWHEQGVDILFGTNNTERMRIESSGVAYTMRLHNYSTSFDPWLKGVNSSNVETFNITKGGAATFNGGNTTINSAGQITTRRTDSTSTSLGVFVGQHNNGTNTSIIFQNGAATFSGNITAGNVSDIRFKKNITDANPQLADVVALGSSLKNWDWKDDVPLNEELRSKRFLGLIAQEADDVCPELSYTVARTKQGKELTPEVVVAAVYETRTVPAVLDDEGKVVQAETTEQVLVTEEQVTPATYEELDDSYKAINHDILVMKLLGAVAELSAKVAALEAG